MNHNHSLQANILWRHSGFQSKKTKKLVFFWGGPKDVDIALTSSCYTITGAPQKKHAPNSKCRNCRPFDAPSANGTKSCWVRIWCKKYKTLDTLEQFVIIAGIIVYHWAPVKGRRLTGFGNILSVVSRNLEPPILVFTSIAQAGSIKPDTKNTGIGVSIFLQLPFWGN